MRLMNSFSLSIIKFNGDVKGAAFIYIAVFLYLCQLYIRKQKAIISPLQKNNDFN